MEQTKQIPFKGDGFAGVFWILAVGGLLMYGVDLYQDGLADAAFRGLLASVVGFAYLIVRRWRNPRLILDSRRRIVVKRGLFFAREFHCSAFQDVGQSSSSYGMVYLTFNFSGGQSFSFAMEEMSEDQLVELVGFLRGGCPEVPVGGHDSP